MLSLITLIYFKISHADNIACLHHTKAEITSPVANKTYYIGSNINIVAKSNNNAYIQHATLYFDGKLVSKKHGPTASWSHHQWRFLRNMGMGSYQIEIHIKEFSGKQYVLERTLKIQGRSMALVNPTYCTFGNPLHSLSWLKKIKQKTPNIVVQEYRQSYVGSYRVAFAIRACGSYRVTWYNCQGKIICQNQKCNTTRGLKLKKTWYKGCR